MAKKKANSFVLTIAGIAAATVIGVVGVKLTPAPHVIFSLAPSAEPQATAEPDPISCVLAGTGQVVDFADPGAEEYVSLLDTDSQSLTERYALPALERMTQSDTESLIAPLQVIQRIQTLGIDPATFDTPEANWKNLYNSVMTRLAPLVTAETAQANPDVLLIAVEKVPAAMVVAMERVTEAGLRNVFFVDGDAALLPDMFAPGEIDRLYINFCDPWPKSNQKKRRLTHGNFLKLYRRVLAEGGQIHFKTDNDRLFAWSLEEIPQFGFRLSEVTTDLHRDGPVGVMTDYERKFFSEGKNINRCVASMVPWEEPAEPEDAPDAE